MDKSEDLELEESSKLEGKPREKEDIEELLIELGGFGKYQKRLLCLITPFLFMTIPLLQHHQVLRVEFCCQKMRIVSSLKAIFSTDICPAQSEAQMPARGGSAHSSGDEPEQRGLGLDLVENGRLVGHRNLHLQVQRIHKGAAGRDQDDRSEESFF